MSQWTHVNACIRFDDIRREGLSFGTPEMGTLPEGSEGPLNFHMVENPDMSAMAAYTVLVWGDLRSYDDVDEIREYFETLTDGKFIRSGIVEIDVERQPPVILRHVSGNDDDLMAGRKIEPHWETMQLVTTTDSET